MFSDEDKPRITVALSDHGAGRVCDLETETKVAHCFSSLPVLTVASRPNSLEKLGTEMIAGLLCEGTRSTFTLPAQPGVAQRVIVQEDWKSPELDVTLRNRSTDTSAGSKSWTVTKLSREEPDSKLFEIPADYQVVEEPTPPAGNGVSKPKVTKKVEPKYTEKARHAKIEGTVTLRVTVGVDGKATDMQVRKSLDPGLDQEAIKAVQQWRFQPGQKDGKPVPVLANIEVNFRLLDNPPSN